VPALDRRIGAERAKLVRFVITGLTGALVNLGSFAVFALGLDVDYRVSVVLAFGLSYGFTFVAHRYWTFEATDDHVGRQGLRFAAVSAVATAWALLLTVIAVEIIGLPQNVSEAAAAVLAAPVSFVLHNNHTFRARTEPQPAWGSGG
jgi:putative flippase GtrA